jgi:HlyD family secretion protein
MASALRDRLAALARHRLVLLAMLAVAAGAAFMAWRAISGPAVRAYRAERGPIVQTVVASGRVESPKRVDIGSQVTGSVASVPVEEGQAVKAGQPLVLLDDSETKAALEQARSAFAQAEAKLVQLRETSLPVAVETARQAEVNLANAERTLQRTQDLFARGFVGQAALDDAQRNRDVARSQLKSAEVQRASESAGGSDFRLAQTALDQARANVDAAKARLAFMRIEAPVDGVLISRNVEKGNVVQPGKSLMVLSPAGETQLVVQFDEKNLSLLRVGQKALASADAYAAQRFAAELVYINPGVDALRGSVEVKLRVPQPPPYLLQDMTVSVDVEVARKDGALVVPADAARDAATASPWMLALNDGHAQRRAVKLGARGDGLVEVLEGLAEGDLVVPSTDQRTREGSRVRPEPVPLPARRSP